MIAILNYLPYIIGLIAAVVIYYQPTHKRRLVTLAVTCGILFVYGVAQPTYMPKGVAKPAAPVVEFTVPEGEIVSRMPKPMSTEERDARQAAKYQEAEQRRLNLMNEIKEGK